MAIMQMGKRMRAWCLLVIGLLLLPGPIWVRAEEAGQPTRANLEGVADESILNITTIGRKSGQLRSVLLYAFPAGDTYAVVASNLGDDAYPLWYLNLKANPAVTVEVEGKRFEAVSREAEGEERERLWAAVMEADPTYTEYQKRTERVIPVIVLEVLESPAGAS